MFRLLTLLFFPAIAIAQLAPLPPNANVQRDPRTGRTTVYVPPGAGSGPIAADRAYSYEQGKTSVQGYAPAPAPPPPGSTLTREQQAALHEIEMARFRCRHEAEKAGRNSDHCLPSIYEERAKREVRMEMLQAERKAAEAEAARARAPRVLPSQSGGTSGGYSCVNHDDGKQSCTHW
jgi:hypothetical protein